MSQLFITEISQGVGAELLTQGDREYVTKFGSAKRKTESLSWRGLLRQALTQMGLAAEAQREILYNSVGAPYIAGSEIYISVSHSATHVAVVIDDKPCGVDIESLDRNFTRVADRYVTQVERLLLLPTPNTPLLPLLWSAKETLYKVSGEEGLDLLSDLIITKIAETTITGEITKKKQRVVMHYTLQGNLIIVYTA